MIILKNIMTLFVGHGREGDVTQKGGRIVSGTSNRHQRRAAGGEDE